MNNKIKIFVPGRLCLFGEHSDWAGKYRTMNAEIVPGKAIVTGIEQGIEAYAEKSDVFEMTCEAPEIKNIWQDFSCKMNSTDLKATARSNSFFCYCAGVASYMLEWYNVCGVHIHITQMTLPLKSGLSSSAAICVLVCRAFNQLYNLNLNTMGEMNIAYVGELRTSSRCGRLDQACAFGVKPVCMTFDGEEIEVAPVNVKVPLYWVFADLNAQKDTIKILADLNKAYPFATNDIEKQEHLALGIKNEEIINRAIEYMNNGDVENLGKLMTEAQQLFDTDIAPLCKKELTAPKLHKVLNDKYIMSLSYGGKGVGSQGDGSIQFLAKDLESQKKIINYLNDNDMPAYSLTIKPRHTVRKAIIPVAGYGTRLFPETKIFRKEFLPIIDHDGIVKPVILVLLEGLIKSGIEEICIVLGSDEEREEYRNFFENRVTDEHFQKLTNQSKEYENIILSIGKKLTYVFQKEKRGFGHAVYQAAEFAGEEPVLLLLGDTIYRSNTQKSCFLQLIEAYEGYNRPMIAIHPIPHQDVSMYGIMTGLWENKEETLMNITKFVEKPTMTYASDHLKTYTKMGKEKYYSVFGQYILTPEVFQQLHKDINENGKESEDIELTSALEKIRTMNGMYGVQLDGEMFDMGNPKAYKELMTNF